MVVESIDERHGLRLKIVRVFAERRQRATLRAWLRREAAVGMNFVEEGRPMQAHLNTEPEELIKQLVILD